MRHIQENTAASLEAGAHCWRGACDAGKGKAGSIPRDVAQTAARCPTLAIVGDELPRGFRAFCKRTTALCAATQARMGHLHRCQGYRVELYALTGLFHTWAEHLPNARRVSSLLGMLV